MAFGRRAVGTLMPAASQRPIAAYRYEPLPVAVHACDRYGVTPGSMPLVRKPGEWPQHRSGDPHVRRAMPKVPRWVVGIGICLAVSAVLAVALWRLDLVGRPPEFDCRAGFENGEAGWSDLKKQYCCEEEGVGCHFTPGGLELQPAYEEPPRWLQYWLGDMSVGAKFLVAGLVAWLGGCACGAGLYLLHVRSEMKARRVETEHELMHEFQKALQRVGAKTGEIAVTLMWDTKDDLDLHVMLPGDYGEISAENPRCAGGRLDVDGNHLLEMASARPIENIYWPHCDRSSNRHPPIGEYTVYVKVKDRHAHHSHDEANLTVVITVQGKQDVYHLRLLPGSTQVHVTSFEYKGPRQQAR